MLMVVSVKKNVMKCANTCQKDPTSVGEVTVELFIFTNGQCTEYSV